MVKQSWETYEEVAQYLLDQFADKFGLSGVEGKQSVKGLHSGTTWTIDAKGIRQSDGATIIVECRRKTTTKMNQEALAAIAYRILDTDAGGAITVSPFDHQKGAKLVAAANNIVHVQLPPESTTLEYVLKFLNNIFVTTSEVMQTGENVVVVLSSTEDTSPDE